ncbi:MAG: SRPBCC family protein [Myxococcota bacterium]
MLLATNTIRVEASEDDVWRVLAHRFGDIGQWCATVNSSSPQDGTRISGAPCSGRYCDTVFGPFTEVFTQFDDREKAMKYDARSEKLPFFIRKFTNEFHVRPDGPTGSEVTMVAGADMVPPFGFLFRFLMRMQVGKALMNQMEELKYFAEHGQPHPRKVAAQARLGVPKAALPG